MSFEATLRAAGLMPRDVVPDGRWRRCATEDHPRKRNGAYKLAVDGRIGWWRNWALDADLNDWRDEDATQAQPIDPAVIRARRAREQAHRREAIQYARALWARGARYSLHPYLVDKGLGPVGCDALRTWTGSVWVDGVQVRDRWLLAPMTWRGQIVNVQRINAGGVKRQVAGAPQVGSTLQLTRPGAAVTVIVEGLATGLAVFQSVRRANVIVAFYADNLMPVLQELRPTGSVVIAADNDHRTFLRRGVNPGVDKAVNAAELIGCGVAWPQGIEGTDWCDALKEWGPPAQRRIEREILAAARFVM